MCGGKGLYNKPLSDIRSFILLEFINEWLTAGTFHKTKGEISHMLFLWDLELIVFYKVAGNFRLV